MIIKIKDNKAYRQLKLKLSDKVCIVLFVIVIMYLLYHVIRYNIGV